MGHDADARRSRPPPPAPRARSARTADVGAIEPGRYGDLVAVDGDPLADVRQLEHPAFVMKGGAVVVAPK